MVTLFTISRQQIGEFFLFFPQNRIWHFMENCLQWRQFAWNVQFCFLSKIRKIFQYVVCWIFYPARVVNSADDKLAIFFLFFPEKKDLTFHANCLQWRQYAWNVKSCFMRKIRKIFQYVCWNFYPARVANSAIVWRCFSYFSQKTRLDISCKLSPMETICMKCQILFSEKNKKNISICLLKIFTQHAEQ